MTKDSFKLEIVDTLGKMAGKLSKFDIDESLWEFEDVDAEDKYTWVIVEDDVPGANLPTILSNADKLIRDMGYEKVWTFNYHDGAFYTEAERPLGVPEVIDRAKLIEALEAVGFSSVDKLHSIAFNLGDGRATVQDTSHSAPKRLVIR